MRLSIKIFLFFVALLAIFSLSVLPAQAIGLGLAGDFNCFIFDSAERYSGDTINRVAVGGDATFTNFAIDQGFPPNLSGDLIVGGNLKLYQAPVGQTQEGTIFVGGSYSIIESGTPSVTQGFVPIDFGAQKDYLTQYSQFWASLPANGIIDTTIPDHITLIGTDSSLNIFQLPGTILDHGVFDIQVPSSSTVLVNLPGDNAQMKAFGYGSDGFDPSFILYNFYEATILNLAYAGIQGSILAPYAQINFDSASVAGTLIGSSISSIFAEEYNYPFSGNLPATAVPEPSTLLLLGTGIASIVLWGRKGFRS